MPFGMRAVEADTLPIVTNDDLAASPMPFGMRAVEALVGRKRLRRSRDRVTNAFRHEGR